MIDPENAEYWTATAQGKLLIKHCRACGSLHWYPRARCPHCGSGETDFRPAAGTGTIYSVTIVRRADPPYVLAYVTLDEGVTMLTNIVACAPDAVQIGDRVEVVYKPAADGSHVPMFRPVP